MALPGDLIDLILLKLPVKSLSRFKCVCKSWRDAISSASFVLEQADHAKKVFQDRETYIIFSGNDKFEAMVYDESSDEPVSGPLSFNPVDAPREIVENCPGFEGGKQATVMGYCDGMLCVRVVYYSKLDDQLRVRACQCVYLWNPSIRDIKNLPFSRQEKSVDALHAMTLHNCFGRDLYGIGHNPCVNDYYICKIPSETSQGNRLVELFYLKSNSWKSIGQILDYNVNSFQSATFLKGSLHWLAHNVATQESVILYVNAVEEKLRELDLPEQDEDRSSSYTFLDIFQGNLCLTKRCCNGIKIWMYADSWVKVGHVPYPLCLTLHSSYGVQVLMWPLCITRRGIYLAEEGSRYVVRYNPEDEKTSDKFEVPGETKFVYRFEHLETLVSPSALITRD